MQQTKLVHRRNIIQQRALSSNPQSPRITARAKYTRALLVGATGYRRFPHGELPNGTLLYIFLFLSGRGGAHSNAKGPPSLHLRSLHWGWVFVCLMFFGPNIAWPKSPRFGSLTRAVLRFLVNIVIPILFSSTSRVWFHSTYRGGNSRKKKHTSLKLAPSMWFVCWFTSFQLIALIWGVSKPLQNGTWLNNHVLW